MYMEAPVSFILKFDLDKLVFEIALASPSQPKIAMFVYFISLIVTY